MAVTSAEPVDAGDPSKGIKITVANLGQLVLPATLRVQLTNGTHVDTTIPVETWMQNTSHTFTIYTPSAVNSVVLDPDHALPIMDRRKTTKDLTAAHN